MSRFFSPKYAALTPYTPGEQPQDKAYIKLNTNESPFAPSARAVAAAARAAESLELYSDPACRRLVRALAERYGVDEDEVVCGNGSDEILNFAFMAFCDENTGAAFADVTYGFYRVFAQLHRIPYTEVPLKEDLSLDVADYFGLGKTVFIANPNAPTGRALPRAEIERLLKQNPDHVVVVDEAYVDFGGESCVPLIHRYPNLLVVQTFSKSRSLAGGRLGYAIGDRALIRDLQTLRFSTNPYNVNAMTLAMGEAVLADEETTRANCQTVMQNRAWTQAALGKMGFFVLPSSTNFLFAAKAGLTGEQLYLGLKERGILVRHFGGARTRDYIRITIGSDEQMRSLIDALGDVIQSQGNI